MDEIIDIPDDSDAAIFSAENEEKLRLKIDSCQEKNELLDTLTVHTLLNRLTGNGVQVLSCLSPVDKVDLPYIGKYLNRSMIRDDTTTLLIPLCDGSHFRGYIVDMNNKLMINVDSYDKNYCETEKLISKCLFEENESKTLSLFPCRVQFDGFTCGCWLIAGMASHVLEYALPLKRKDAFKIVKKLIYSECVLSTPSSCGDSSDCDESKTSSINVIDVKTLTSTDFLLPTLLKSPETSEYFKDKPLKGVRKNIFYIVDSRKWKISDITADDNGAYIKRRTTTSPFYYDIDNGLVKIARRTEEGKFFISSRNSRSYESIPVDKNNVFLVCRRYCDAKSFPLKRIVVNITCMNSGDEHPYTGIIYLCSETIDQNVQPHGNSKLPGSITKPYIRTSPDLLLEAANMLSAGKSYRKIYDDLHSKSGGVYESTTQSVEPRNIEQIRRVKQSLTKNSSDEKKSNDNDELAVLINNQKEHPNIIPSISILSDSYSLFLSDAQQLQDVDHFCCKGDSVLSIDTTFNLCDNWVTDTSYPNKRIINKNGLNPIFLGPTLIHFRKDESIFRRLLLEMIAVHPKIVTLKTIGTDQEKAIFNGFKSVIPSLKLLLCVFHLRKLDDEKLKKMGASSYATNIIVNDIYGKRYGSVQEYGLAESLDSEDLEVKLKSLEDNWSKLCPGFYEWFQQRRKIIFENNVIQSARKDTDIAGLFYNNSIECAHYREKVEQSFQKGKAKDVIQSFNNIIQRQQDDEIRSLYGNGPYSLSVEYQRFFVDSAKWHKWSSEKRKQHIKSFRSHYPSLSESFVKPKSAGRKSSASKRKRPLSPDVIIGRFEISSPSVSEEVEKINRIEDPRGDITVPYVLHLRSLVPRLVQKCQGSCGRKLLYPEKKSNDYLIVKSHGKAYWTDKNGQQQVRYGPQYIHFQEGCLINYVKEKHDIFYDGKFPFEEIRIDEHTRKQLSPKELQTLQDYNIDI